MRYRFHTTDPDKALEWIQQRYTNHSANMSAKVGFSFEHRKLDADSFTIAYIHHRAGLEMDVDPYDQLVVAHPQQGRFAAANHKEVLQFSRGETFLYPLRSRCRVSWDDVTLGLVRLDRLATAARVAGKDADIIPSASVPISADRAQSWHDLVSYISRQMLLSGTMSSPLVRTAAFGLLAATFTQTFPCRVPALSRRYAVSGPSAVVRRAVEFVESHAHEPITIDDIAEAARIGPRGLQVAFRRHLDTTPTEYLRRVRLDLAHRHLAAADPESDTVKRIAARWGFSNVSRFSRAYAAQYGCSPLVTLHS